MSWLDGHSFSYIIITQFDLNIFQKNSRTFTESSSQLSYNIGNSRISEKKKIICAGPIVKKTISCWVFLNFVLHSVTLEVPFQFLCTVDIHQFHLSCLDTLKRLRHIDYLFRRKHVSVYLFYSLSICHSFLIVVDFHLLHDLLKLPN